MAQRRAWHIKLTRANPSSLVFLDETGAKTNMTRLYARAKKGQRARDYAPHGHWSTTTLVAALTVRGAVAPMVLDGPMDRLAFEAYVDQVLIPALAPGAIVVMDNLSAHKSPSIAAKLQAAGTSRRQVDAGRQAGADHDRWRCDDARVESARQDCVECRRSAA